MPMISVRARVRVAWWLKLHFYGLATCCALTGREPDWGRVSYWINKGVCVDFREPLVQRCRRAVLAVFRWTRP